MHCPTSRRPLHSVIALLLLPMCLHGGGSMASDSTPRPKKLEDRVYGSWSILCPPARAQACTMSQVVSTDRLGSNAVLGVSVHFKEGTSTPKIDFRLTPDALFSTGVGLRVGGLSDYRLAMSTCNPTTCLASGWLTEPLLSELRRARAAQFAFFLKDRRQILVPISLAGFGEAYAELKRSVMRKRIGALRSIRDRTHS